MGGTTASRQKARIFESQPEVNVNSGLWTQVSRLGNPLVNEVLIPMAAKDYWNAQVPSGDSQFAARVSVPELAAWDGTHTGIRRRDLPDAVAHAAVFGSLEAGGYQVRLRGVSAERPDAGLVVDLSVVGGEITQREWPGT